MLARHARTAIRGEPTLLAGLEKLQKAMRPTPVVALEHATLSLYAKLECANLAGSVKDRPALWILKSAIERREIDAGTTVIESSSGNFAMALATFCRVLGLRFIPVIDPNISPVNEAALRSVCDEVALVETRDDTGGYLKTRLNKVRELLKTIPNSYWTNQYGNPDGARAHYDLTAGEICEQMPNLDFVFLGVSTGGTINGVSRRIKERFPAAKVIAVDAVGSVIFGGTPQKRYIPGIGASITPELVRQAQIDDVVLVPETDTVAGCHELMDRHGVFAGGSSGSVYTAINRYLHPLRVWRKKPNVLFLCADRGFPYLKTIYNPSWVSWLQEQHGH